MRTLFPSSRVRFRIAIGIAAALFSTTARGGVGVWTTNGPSGVTSPANVVTDLQTPGAIYSGSAQEVFKSTDNGQTWSSVFGQAASPLASGPAGTVYVVANSAQLYKSIDGGAHWDSLITVNGSVISLLAIDAEVPTTVYRVDDHQISLEVNSVVSRSTDGGRTWTEADRGLDGSKITALVADPKTSGTVFVASSPVGHFIDPPGSIFKTTDGGSTWELLTNTLGPYAHLALDPVVPTTVYAASIHGIFKSTNGGSTFSLINSTLTAQTFLTGLVIDPRQPNHLYAGTIAGVYASYDSGVTWTPIDNGLTGPALAVAALAIDSTGTFLHAITSAQGVFDYQISASACQPDAHTLCLNNGGFSVTADFQQTPEGPSAPAMAVPLTNDTGYFWFFGSTNIELVVKVLTGCAINGDYWVFAGGLTNVGVQLKVTDTQAEVFKKYSNAVGTPFQPIQDSSAFPCQ